MIVKVIEPLSRVIPPQWHLPCEINVCGFYVTPIFVVCVLGIALAAFSVWLMGVARLTRFVWHPPLFLFSLSVIYGMLLSFLLLPV